MTPDVLAELCCKRLLSSDHILNMVKLLNTSQSSTTVVYVNYVRNIDRYINANIDSENPPDSLALIVNIGTNKNGTLCADDLKEGSHWAIALYEYKEARITYCDSLGWRIPAELISKIKQFSEKLYHTQEVSVVYCHDPQSHRQGIRKCGAQCKVNYPLQSCGSVCGVVVLIIAVIICFKKDYFTHLTNVSEESHYVYLREPSKYSKYLRSVLMVWIASQSVNIDYVIPPVNIQEESDSDSDEELPRVDIQYEEVNVVKSVFVDNNIKSKGFNCPVCLLTFTKKPNMRRHVQHKHKENTEAIKGTQTSKSICLECGFRCRRIVELRKHLSSRHNFTFRSEIENFKNKEGSIKVFILVLIFHIFLYAMQCSIQF